MGERANEDGFEIANEFARVWVRKVHTRNGMRLEIRSARLDSGVQLDAVLLESLTWQTDETLAGLLANPFQPATPDADGAEERAE